MAGLKKRVTMKLKNPNPLFQQWLTEWRDEAIEKDSKMQYCFTKALSSLKKYPLPLETGRDCKILQGFGDKLCEMLDNKLLKHLEVTSSGTSSSGKKRKLSTSSQKVYVPTFRSGAYAILVTLYKQSLLPAYPGFMYKSDIIKNGQHLCDKSFSKPDAGSFYTSWSSMKTLLEKNLIIKIGSPAKFSLTDEGIVLASQLANDQDEKIVDDVVCIDSDDEDSKNKLKAVTEKPADVIENKAKRLKTTASKKTNKKTTIAKEDENELINEEEFIPSTTQIELFSFAPSSFEIVLLVDKQETVGSSKELSEDPALSILSRLNVNYEVRHLKVGDYTWICRQEASKRELILPYIVERKRMDDLGGSIKDGRFYEQKFRLKQSGVQNLIYLIENFGNNTHTGLPLSSLYQAATNTLIQDEFCVKFTDDVRGTMEYLATFTMLLNKIYKSKTLTSCAKENLVPSAVDYDTISLMTFSEFNKGSSKSRHFKVQEMFIRQLLQLKGMSVEKAIAITEKYPTPLLLYRAYVNSTASCSGEKLLMNIEFGKLKKKVGAVLSKTVYQLFISESF